MKFRVESSFLGLSTDQAEALLKKLSQNFTLRERDKVFREVPARAVRLERFAAHAFASTSRLIVNNILRDITHPIGSVNTSQINLSAKERGA